MKILTSVLVLLVLSLIQPAYSCDEQCLRTQAEAALNKKFPKYLTWSECGNVANNFMTNVMVSLKDFRSRKLNPKYKGPFKNIRSELEKQKAWLQECDSYLRATNKKRIFGDDKSTDAIYASIDLVKKELTATINGVTYSDVLAKEPNYIMKEKFDFLFQVVDNYKTLMHMKGQYVIR